MRLAYVNQDAGIAPGRKKGAAIHVVALRRAFAQLGCEVIAIDAKSDEAVREALEGALRGGELDLVYERQALGACSAARFCRERNVPLYLEVNAPLIDEAREHRGHEPSAGDLEAERLVLDTASHLFPVSNLVKRYLEARGVPRQRLHVTPNGVDTECFRPRSAPPSLDLAADAFVIGFHGRLRPWHNFALLVEAFGLLVARGYPVHLVTVGEGDFAAHLQPALLRRATLLGWMEPDELAAHVASFHALPLSYSPGASCYFSPLKLLEAMACGAVPVVPELGDLPAAVQFGRCGLIVPPGDARALADALAGLIEWPDVRVRLSRAAAAHASSRSWIKVAAEVLQHAGVVVP